MNVTPLIDVVFILLVFFMLTTNFARFRLIGVDAPQETEVVTDPAAAIVILVKADGSFEYDGDPAEIGEIRNSVESIIAVDPGRPFLVRPERGVTMQEALDVFQLSRDAGAYAVSFSRPADEEPPL
ncbi:MAG: biopolymer transporter ExbD [Pseudomonadota bacterium]